MAPLLIKDKLSESSHLFIKGLSLLFKLQWDSVEEVLHFCLKHPGFQDKTKNQDFAMLAGGFCSEFMQTNHHELSYKVVFHLITVIEPRWLRGYFYAAENRLLIHKYLTGKKHLQAVLQLLIPTYDYHHIITHLQKPLDQQHVSLIQKTANSSMDPVKAKAGLTLLAHLFQKLNFIRSDNLLPQLLQRSDFNERAYYLSAIQDPVLIKKRESSILPI